MNRLNKGILSIILVLVMVITLTAMVFAETDPVKIAIEPITTTTELTPTTEITFNDMLSISNVIKVTNGYDDESFDSEKVDKLIGVIGEDYYLDEPEIYYCAGAPVTVTFIEDEDYGPYGISSYRYYYEDVKLEPTADISRYAITWKNFEGSETINAEAFKGTIILTKPGTYYFYVTNWSSSGEDCELGLYVVVPGDTTPEPVYLPAVARAIPTPSKVYVNGQLTEFEAYGINGYNYFKLRDLAKVVSGTEKNFEVTWDNEKKTINLVSNQPYTEVGGELAKGDGTEKTAKINTSVIYKDGEVVQLAAYTINGNNYFKLRDVAQAFNIGITWDGATSTIGVDTTIDYVP